MSFSNAVAKPLLLYLEVIIFAPLFCVVLLLLLKLSFSPGRTGGFQLLRNKDTEQRTTPLLCELKFLFCFLCAVFESRISPRGDIILDLVAVCLVENLMSAAVKELEGDIVACSLEILGNLGHAL